MKFEINKTYAQELIREFYGQTKSEHPILDKILEELSNINGGEVEGENIDISAEKEELIYPAEVRIEKTQYSISHTQTLLRKRKELVLNPDFQRRDVWSKKQQSELVESVLMGIPIPIIYLFEDKKGKKQVVDGKQRITTLVSFLEGKFNLSDLRILKHLNNKCFFELDYKLQGIIEDFQLFYYIIQPPTPERIKYNIFDRVNRSGTRINKQEMRNALYGGKCVKLLKCICKSQQFLTATDHSLNGKRMKDQYTALRCLAFLMLRDGTLEKEADITYKGDIDDFLAKFMCYINESATKDIIRHYLTVILSALERSCNVLGFNGFRFNGGDVRRPINMPLMEAIVYYFAKKEDISNKEAIIANLNNLKEVFDNSKYFQGNIDSTTSIDYRFGEIERLLNLDKND